MRITIFAYADYDFLFPAICRLISRIKEEHKFTAASLALFPNKLGRHEGWKIARYYFSLLGPVDFVKLALRSLTARARQLVDVCAGRLPALTYEGMAKGFRIPVAHFHSPNDKDAIAWVRSQQTDILLIFVGQILKKEIIEAPRQCTLNKHSALLPAYKGLFPVFWAKKNGDPVGVSVHEVIEAIDSGRLLCQQICDHAGLSVYDHYGVIYRQAPELLMRSLKVAAGLSEPATVQHDLPTGYYGLPSRADYLAFKRAGHRFS